MNLPSSHTSLELSRKLKELGVKQESAFYWCSEYGEIFELTQYRMYQTIAAFSVAELGEMLPALDCHSRRVIPGEWFCEYSDYISNVGFPVQFTADTEANARAKMLIYLIENNLITVTEINRRVQ